MFVSSLSRPVICRFAWSLALAVVLLASLSIRASAAPTDWNFDGASELSIVNIGGDGTLSWSGVLGSDGSLVDLGTQGRIGDHLVPGPWFMQGQVALGTVRLLSNGVVRWDIRDSRDDSGLSFEFGTAPLSVVGGADVDGNGVLDAVVVSKERSRLRWAVLLNPGLGGTREERSLSFGGGSLRPFFFSPDGRRDALAVLSARDIKYRYLDSRKSRRVALRGSVRGTDIPLPLRSRSGEDVLMFLRDQGASTLITKLLVKRRAWRRVRLDSSGIGVVGDFLPQPGEEIALRGTDAGAFKILNPFSRTRAEVSGPSGILVDEVNINTFGDSNKEAAPGGPPAAPVKWPECPRFDDIRGGFIVLPGSNFPSVKVILPTSFTSLNPSRNVSVALVGPSKSMEVPFDAMANPDPVILRAHYTLRQGCREVAAELGSSRPIVEISGKGPVTGSCRIELEQGRNICERSD